MATPESGAQMRTRYSTVNTVPTAATRYTTTASFASWRSLKSCSVFFYDFHVSLSLSITEVMAPDIRSLGWH